jgi:hypothetical protein
MMREKSPDEYIDTLEHRFRRRARVRAFLTQLAVTTAFVPDQAAIKAAFEENQRPDTLPHD